MDDETTKVLIRLSTASWSTAEWQDRLLALGSHDRKAFTALLTNDYAAYRDAQPAPLLTPASTSATSRAADTANKRPPPESSSIQQQRRQQPRHSEAQSSSSVSEFNPDKETRRTAPFAYPEPSANVSGHLDEVQAYAGLSEFEKKRWNIIVRIFDVWVRDNGHDGLMTPAFSDYIVQNKARLDDVNFTTPKMVGNIIGILRRKDRATLARWCPGLERTRRRSDNDEEGQEDEDASAGPGPAQTFSHLRLQEWSNEPMGTREQAKLGRTVASAYYHHIVDIMFTCDFTDYRDTYTKVADFVAASAWPIHLETCLNGMLALVGIGTNLAGARPAETRTTLFKHATFDVLQTCVFVLAREVVEHEDEESVAELSRDVRLVEALDELRILDVRASRSCDTAKLVKAIKMIEKIVPGVQRQKYNPLYTV